MGLICTCPVGAEIPDVPINACVESFGQIQKVILQRIFSTGSTKNSIANPLLLASWSALLSSSTGTKVVQTPYIQAPTTEAGAARTYGGGNETLGGIEIIVGREATTFTGNILQATQDTIKALKQYQCENIGIWLVDEFGRMGGIVDNYTTPTKYYPIPIASFFVGDKTLGGLEGVDMNTISWKFFPNWSDDLKIFKPTDFNPLTDLVNP